LFFEIKRNWFQKVVIGAMDSHDKVNGKGKKILDAGIETISGILEEECRELNKRFFTFHEKNVLILF
jgi:diaminohydroxyphosphoribosylaminopyrimidine deaminase/5-amino-6-(5-phosphoribosylamino)uracil reductase